MILGLFIIYWYLNVNMFIIKVKDSHNYVIPQ